MPHQKLTDSLYDHVTSLSDIPHLHQYSDMRGHPSAHLHKTSSVHATPAAHAAQQQERRTTLSSSVETTSRVKEANQWFKPAALWKTSIWSSCSNKAWRRLLCKIWTLTQSQARLPKSERVNSINNNVEPLVEEWKYPRLQHLTRDYSLTLIMTWSKCAPMHIFTCNKFRLERLHSLFWLSGDTAAD